MPLLAPLTTTIFPCSRMSIVIPSGVYASWHQCRPQLRLHSCIGIVARRGIGPDRDALTRMYAVGNIQVPRSGKVRRVEAVIGVGIGPHLQRQPLGFHSLAQRDTWLGRRPVVGVTDEQ